MALSILLNGSLGRMGQAILKTAPELDAQIVAAIDKGDVPAEHIGKAQVVVDFSFHSVTPQIVALAAERKLPVVIGTTGHTAAEREAIVAHTATIPIIWAGNYSVGVNLLFHLVGQAAKILDASYATEIIEMHHRHKVDAPSGTAERLLEVVLEARKLNRSHVRHGREGLLGARPQDEVGMHALRGGDVVGDHTVLFAGEGERLELTHKASDRRIFAAGAIRAAHWAVSQKPGLYNMEDVLGLR